MRDEAAKREARAARVPAGEPHGPESRVLGFALAAIGAINLWRGDFTIVYHPMPDFLPARAVVAGLCNAALLGTGAAIAIDRARRPAAVVLAGVLVFLSLGWIVRVLLFPAIIGTWLGLAEQLALAIGALAVFAQTRTGPLALPAICRIGFGLCQMVFALGHWLGLAETIAMTPAYLPPGPRFWALATGGLHLAGGMLLLSGIRPVLTTQCLAAMFGAFGLLVWLPALFGAPNAANWAGNLINLALIGAVLAVGDAARVDGRRGPAAAL
jgi:hypothetical protein